MLLRTRSYDRATTARKVFVLTFSSAGFAARLLNICSNDGVDIKFIVMFLSSSVGIIFCSGRFSVFSASVFHSIRKILSIIPWFDGRASSISDRIPFIFLSLAL
jgi:hypothetical protein